ncbi:MFS transporter [Rhodococcus sp. IEGM 1366]|uniref:MFS transporter n=1 Tax=Rhodococcus sp. IEGM 1366 TaxID=3082223 RepID=UPI0029554B5F|nr:MFS transporter [Rhodococcus sp. IEGM 1366]MDV8071393.1 MFS transporter [Rhodococcus sp. IEGM 1366]
MAALVLLTEQTALGFTLIAPALIGFGAEYQTDQVIWMITIYTLVGSVTTPIIGKLGDRYGKRRILITCALLAATGSAVSALAPTFAIVLVGRGLSGVSGAFLPLTFALMRDVFPERYRSLSISIATNGVGVVTIAGPFLAGYLIDNISLDSVFWFTGILSLVGALGTIALVPESPVRNTARIDLVGAAGLMLGIFLIMLGISQISQWDFVDIRTFAVLGGGVVVLAAWWRWESHTSEPFIDTSLLTSRPIGSIILAYGLAVASTAVMGSYLPQMLQTPRGVGGDYGFGLSATGFARYAIPAGILLVLSGIFVGLTAKRFGYRIFLIVGPLFFAFGAIGLAFFTTQPWMPIVFYSITGFGAVVYAAGPSLLMLTSPAAVRGITAAMMGSVGGVLTSSFTQASGLILNKNVAVVVQGYPAYTGKGFTLVFLVAAAMAIAASVVALSIPRTEKQVHSQRAEEALVVIADDLDSSRARL